MTERHLGNVFGFTIIMVLNDIHDVAPSLAVRNQCGLTIETPSPVPPQMVA